MTDSIALSKLITPLITQFSPKTILTAGEAAATCLQTDNDTRIHHLKTPYHQQQLEDISAVDLAIISELTESLSKPLAQAWLGTIKNYYAPHIILISHPTLAAKHNWQFTDYLAMGFKHIAGSQDGLRIFSYAIENYQPKRDWLNSRFWANPEMYDKYRW
ncbi:hypothetical protein LCGC14_1621280 [marine sediment metagenome]|uniref:Uncharacterized protein n=1 Tax=marine sediment metagenome TaxID=412755 RepID=A0A0F9I5F1_9ZZZZ